MQEENKKSIDDVQNESLSQNITFQWHHQEEDTMPDLSSFPIFLRTKKKFQFTCPVTRTS